MGTQPFFGSPQNHIPKKVKPANLLSRWKHNIKDDEEPTIVKQLIEITKDVRTSKIRQKNSRVDLDLHLSITSRVTDRRIDNGVEGDGALQNFQPFRAQIRLHTVLWYAWRFCCLEVD